MILIRLLVMAFNVAVVTYLIYRLLQIYRDSPKGLWKNITLIAGLTLLLMPTLMLVRIIPPTIQYLFIYPVAVSLFLYLARKT